MSFFETMVLFRIVLMGLTDFSSSIALQPGIYGTAQVGDFSISGEANIETNLVVVGDLVVQANVWGGSSDDLRDFGTSCSDGQFVKGIDNNTDELKCRPL